jgi:hypothetical protein
MQRDRKVAGERGQYLCRHRGRADGASSFLKRMAIAASNESSHRPLQPARSAGSFVRLFRIRFYVFDIYFEKAN